MSTAVTAAPPRTRPILMNAAMVRAVLAGRKTQTRRILDRDEPTLDFYGYDAVEWFDKGHSGPGWYAYNTAEPDEDAILYRCPFGRPGDRLYVRETWAPTNPDHPRCRVSYRADMTSYGLDGGWAYHHDAGESGLVHPEPLFLGSKVPPPAKWRPSLHMPLWAARIVMEVTAVRVERLQAIQHREADAIAEGLTVVEDMPGTDFPCTYGVDGKQTNRTAWAAFGNLWKSLYPEGDAILQTKPHPAAWSANPWVWVVEFKVITTNAHEQGAMP